MKGKSKYILGSSVKEMIVIESENHYFCSLGNYADLESALKVEVVFMGSKSICCNVKQIANPRNRN